MLFNSLDGILESTDFIPGSCWRAKTQDGNSDIKLR